MAENLKAHADARPDVPALVDERGETSWARLDERVNRLIHVLRRAGLEAGSTVAILSGNTREYFEVFCACAHASLIAVPINWHFAAEEVTYVLENSDAAALLASEQFGELAAEAAAGLRLGLRAVFGDGPAPAGFEHYEEQLASVPAHEPDEQGQGGVMFYTSGTTGRPKGVRRRGALGAPLEPLRARAQGFGAMLGIPRGGVTLLCGPIYHSAQWAFSMFPLELGSTIVSRHRFDPAETLALIDRHRVTNVHLVPIQFVRLLRLDSATQAAFDGSSLVQVLHGAAPCPPEIKRRMIEWWGPVITEYYGGTEGAVISLISARDWLERPTSLGRPLPMVEVRVIGDDGKPCPSGVSGQLYIKNVMAADFEYHKDATKTASVHREPGLFTMGDVGMIDEDGYLHLTDRKIDMIISGGVNIYPAEIERVLGDHPAVADVAVFGIPDEEYGEQVKAAIVPRDPSGGSDELAAELIAYCRKRLAGYKAPKSIDFEERLPRQETGKLYKRLLRDRYWKSPRPSA